MKRYRLKVLACISTGNINSLVVFRNTQTILLLAAAQWVTGNGRDPHKTADQFDR